MLPARTVDLLLLHQIDIIYIYISVSCRQDGAPHDGRAVVVVEDT